MATIVSFHDVETSLAGGAHAVLLYSGGLDGSYCLTRIARHADRLTALCVDIGGDPLSDVALEVCRTLGIELVQLDRRAEFVRDFVQPAILAHATYLGGHPISASLSRPLMAKAAVEFARERGYSVILHTADPSQNSLRRFNGAFRSLGFSGAYGSPFARDSASRDEKRSALAKMGLHGFENRMFSLDSNLWGREFEAGALDDPERDVAIPSELYRCSERAAAPRELSVRLEHGLPVALDGTALPVAAAVDALNEIGGRYKLGRYVGLEEIGSGAKVQEAREMPAAQILFDAYRRVEAATVRADGIREKMALEHVWVNEAVEGRWFAPLRRAAQAFIESIAEDVTGEVTYRLDTSVLEALSIRASNPLYVRSREAVHGAAFPGTEH